MRGAEIWQRIGVESSATKKLAERYTGMVMFKECPNIGSQKEYYNGNLQKREYGKEEQFEDKPNIRVIC